MTRRHLALAAFLLASPQPSHAHRVDEYLQATIISIDRDSLHASMRLIPGTAVAATVIAAIDTDHDGLFSPAEQQAYAARILSDVALTADSQPLQPKLLAATFPQPTELQDGLGEIHLDFTATVPKAPGSRPIHRTLTIVNHHRPTDPAYLVNALAPTDPTIHLDRQSRNEQQSIYHLDYTQSAP